MEEFINLRQGGTSTVESLKFTKLSKYVPSLLSNRRDEMSHFVIGFSDELFYECRLGILHDNMDMSNFMVHTQQVYKTSLVRKNTDIKREDTYEGGTSKGMLEIQDNPMFKKRFSNQVPTKFFKDIKDTMDNPRS